ncbi:MAG: argininosuccinate lyase [Polyangiales bacterium]
MSNRTWGGRFSMQPDALAAAFGASVDCDRRLAREDIEGSRAHARMLAAQELLSAADLEAIETGLTAIAADIEAGRFEWDVAREDVHMNIEAALSARIGAAGGRLHTARSRNDQVATDMRLWTRAACTRLCVRLQAVQVVLVRQAEAHIDVLMPGYTHLQRAQPVRLAHHLLAWVEMLERDRSRALDCQQRLNECPLGAGALATTTLAIDRAMTATALGFARPMRNSLDAVADRDFLVEALAVLANTAIHLSRIAEELVVWNSQEFAFVEMSDAFATGSSMMPQKKNPDMAELIRGKSGRVVGALVNLLVTLKGLPLTYNRDLQEDKAPVFDAFDTVEQSLAVLAAMLGEVRFCAEAMRAALQEGFVDATELADYLVRKGVPFREAHHVAGRCVARAVAAGTTLGALPLAALQAEHGGFAADVYQAIDAETMVERRDVLGGPARRRVQAALEDWRERLAGRGVQW